MATEYFNNSFNAYVNYVYKEYNLKATNNFLLKVIKILPVILWRTVKDAGIELVFLLLFWVVLAKMSQGRDLVVSLFEPDGLYGYKRIVFTTLAVLSLSVSMWIIPAFMFHQRELHSKYSNMQQRPLHDHLFFMHRVLPLVPFWLMASVLFNSHTIVFVLAAIAELVLLHLGNQWISKERIRNRAIIVTAVVFTVSSGYFFYIFHEAYTAAKVVLSVNLYLLSVLMFLVYHRADSRILDEHDAAFTGGPAAVWSLIWKYRYNSIAYFLCVAIHITIVLVIYYLPFRINFAPESMLLYMFSLYVFGIDLFFYFVNVSKKRQLITAGSFIGLVLLMGVLHWHFNTSHYAMDKNIDSTFFQKRFRDDFSARYEVLRNSILANKTGVPYPIILISGEGGGSRAGLWFSQNLINFDLDTKGKFRDHIFSISTVSGSSIGLSTYLTYWDKTRDANEIDKKWNSFPAAVFENNFVGSSIRGLLLTDLYKSLVPGTWVKDRNSTLQNEEAACTERALLKINGDANWNCNDLPDSTMTLKKDFMSFFYEKSGDSIRYRKNTPIVLINTCRSNDGRRGIFSSIRLDDIHFNEAIDVAGYLYEDSISDAAGLKKCDGRKMPITLGQACNTSELFPLFSAPAYVSKLGSFVDGGYHENSGLKSTLDIYQELKVRLENDTAMRGKYKIYIVYLKNGSGEKRLYKDIESEPVLLQPIHALFNQPFEGSASYFEEKARVLSYIDDNADFIPVNLNPKKLVESKLPAQNKSDLKKKLEPEILEDLINDIVPDTVNNKMDTILNFPLARWLSKTVIDRIQMCAYRKNLSTQLDQLIEQVKAVNRISGAPEKANNQFPVYPELKMEQEDSSYRNKVRKAFFMR